MRDPVELEIFKSLFHSIAEEMGAALRRTAFSPNIKERREYSCAVFNGAGEVVAMGDHMPVHLGSMPMSVRAAVETLTLNAGDVAILNDPFCGGTHLPDITLVAPVFVGGKSKGRGAVKPAFYVASRAHHADVGGTYAGSMGTCREIYQEGIRIPPIKLISRGNLQDDVFRLLLNNVRTPEEREGDLNAQIAACHTGEARLLEITARYGLARVQQVMDELQEYSEKLMRAFLSKVPHGRYEAEDFLDDDGAGSGPVRIIAPKGTVVNARPPAAVAGGNVETSQRIVDVLLRALAKAMPDRVPAGSSGTMNNLTIGGIDERTGEPFAYYETIAGGMGARPDRAGVSGVHTHMTNSLNTPAEALEYAYPLRVTQYSLRKGSGGKGKFRGGDGIVREVELLADSEVTLLADRRSRGPYGLQGGSDGSAGRTEVVHQNGTSETLPGKTSVRLKKGDKVRIESPAGGGWGTSKIG